MEPLDAEDSENECDHEWEYMYSVTHYGLEDQEDVFHCRLCDEYRSEFGYDD